MTEIRTSQLKLNWWNLSKARMQKRLSVSMLDPYYLALKDLQILEKMRTGKKQSIPKILMQLTLDNSNDAKQARTLLRQLFTKRGGHLAEAKRMQLAHRKNFLPSPADR